jgi:SAM-dependent methyltransferase
LNPPKEPVPGESYDPDYFAPLFAIEDRHFWFQGRNPIISSIVRQLIKDMPSGYRVVEVGCGTGSVLRCLENVCADGHVYGLDLFREGLTYAQKRVECPLIQGDILNPPFGAQFDLIGMFDVLEHLPNDVEILRSLHAMLAPHGALVLTVPAYQSLWSYFDEASRHVRRYEKDQLFDRLEKAGFHVEYLSPYMMTIFPLVWLNRKLAMLHPGYVPGNDEMNHNLSSRELRITPVINELLTWMLSQEARLVLKRRKLPVGSSLIAVARK